MEIVLNGDGGNFYGCYNKKAHGDAVPFFLDWHRVLPPRAKKLKEQRDRAVAKQRRERAIEARKNGKKPPERAFHIRARANAKRAANVA